MGYHIQKRGLPFCHDKVWRRGDEVLSIILLFLDRGPYIFLIGLVRQVFVIVPQNTVGIILRFLGFQPVTIASPDTSLLGAFAAPVPRGSFTSSHLYHRHPLVCLENHT
ncbi:MAG: hypothetical protein LUQ04_03110 [Methanoregula sp.]|nr:hypothetical protein [Methanoregula sp.]